MIDDTFIYDARITVEFGRHVEAGREALEEALIGMGLGEGKGTWITEATVTIAQPDDVVLRMTRSDLDELTTWVERGIDDVEYLAGQDAGDYTPDDIAATRQRIERVRSIITAAAPHG